MTIVIAIIGVPGAGKTTLANCLACQLGGPPVVSTDLIRTCALSMGVSDPWLDHVSHHAWKLLGECTPANVLNGYRLHARAVMRTTQEVLRSLTVSYRLVLVEGVHLTTESLDDLANLGHVIPVFLRCTDPDATYRRKARLRHSGGTSWSASLEVIQLIQDYLISSLKDYSGVIRIPDGATVSANARRVMRRVLRQRLSGNC